MTGMSAQTTGFWASFSEAASEAPWGATFALYVLVFMCLPVVLLLGWFVLARFMDEACQAVDGVRKAEGPWRKALEILPPLLFFVVPLVLMLLAWLEGSK